MHNAVRSVLLKKFFPSRESILSIFGKVNQACESFFIHMLRSIYCIAVLHIFKYLKKMMKKREIKSFQRILPMPKNINNSNGVENSWM